VVARMVVVPLQLERRHAHLRPPPGVELKTLKRVPFKEQV
jgi:hypothetical protein